MKYKCFECHVKAGSTSQPNTYSFGLFFLLKSSPDRFAFRNISLSPGIIFFVKKYAHVEMIPFVKSVAIVSPLNSFRKINRKIVICFDLPVSLFCFARYTGRSVSDI